MQDSVHLAITELSHLFETADDVQFCALCDELSNDPRQGVQKLIASAIKKRHKAQLEQQRVFDMYSQANALSQGGIALGIDEVGRGPLAGPLTVAAVALPDEPLLIGLNDSKKLSASHREELASQILEVALGVGIAHIEPQEIDAWGMSTSLRCAMRRAADDAHIDYSALLIDGNPVRIDPLEVAITKGDAKIACIAAASIVAKVTRDHIMIAADEIYPGYGFAKNKGYGSAEHIKAIQTQGLSPYHRASFCSHFV